MEDKKQIVFLKQSIKAFKIVFKDYLFFVLAVSLGLNFLVLDYLIFSQTTTFEVFFSSNPPLYSRASIVLSLAVAVAFGAAFSMLIYAARKKTHENVVDGAASGVFGGIFGVVASGCPVCGALLLPILGIAGSMAVFPFQGLEIKVLALILLGMSINQSAKSVLGICKSPSEKKNKIFPPFVIIVIFISIVYVLPRLPNEYRFNFSGQSDFDASGASSSKEKSGGAANDEFLMEQINPKEGYVINAVYGDIGYKLVRDGVIDFEKFRNIYDKAGRPLTEEQLKIFSDGLNEKISINSDNSYFLLNFFWAFGLANENPVLEEGDMTKYGRDQIGRFASTGGWTVSKKPVMEIYSKSRIVVLNGEQQKKVEEVASNVYRPCCGNSTAFPDCNHGMALLGVLELMAANGASVDEMYKAAKYFNAFWFPQNYLDLAVYFKAKEGKDFKDIDAKTIVGKDYSSSFGWSNVKKWLAGNNLIEKAPQKGGGCGV